VDVWSLPQGPKQSETVEKQKHKKRVRIVAGLELPTPTQRTGSGSQKGERTQPSFARSAHRKKIV